MSFSEFKTLAEVQQKYHLIYQEASFIQAQPIQPTATFQQDLEFCREHIDILSSEAARCEIIISPLLREIYKKYHTQLSFWIQKSIAADGMLSGTPDYVIASRSPLGKTVLEQPIVIIVEAKKNDFEQGWGQCLAELFAAQIINNTPEKPIYGIVTDGILWQFGKLERAVFTKNLENFTLDKLALLYGALHHLIELVNQSYQLRNSC
jgi:hypothetical protein